MNIEDLDSDVSDEDYVPEGQNVELPSEEDSDGDVEDDLIPDQSKKRGKKSNTRKSKKLRTAEVESDHDNDESVEQSKPVTAEEEKKKADSLWADFLKDTDTKPKSINKEKVVETKIKNIPSSTVSVDKKIEKPVEEKKVKVTKIFEFAGEEVRVEKEVPVNSLEAKLSTGSGGIATRGRSPRGRGGGSGLTSVLSQIGKKQKISTLEKTKLDWDKFKKEENIEEELQSFNKGKHG